ncbi:MAG: YHS domain-containing protein [Methanophagales archaeon]|nr:YHS domain-containing protein [Methanophagales archaeon]
MTEIQLSHNIRNGYILWELFNHLYNFFFYCQFILYPFLYITRHNINKYWVYINKGETYYFCAPGCKTAFEENPEEYVG